MAIFIAVVAGTASTMVARPVYAASGSPPPIPGCFPPKSGVPTSDTRVTLQGVQLFNMGGKLVCEKGTTIGNNPGIAGATITFTGSGVPPNAVAKTDSDGNYFFSAPEAEKPGTYNLQAHFSGATLPGPSGVPVFFTGSDSDIVTIHVKQTF
jgi:hypothetical protein